MDWENRTLLRKGTAFRLKHWSVSPQNAAKKLILEQHQEETSLKYTANRCPECAVWLHQVIGSLSSDGGNGNENVIWKYNFISFVLLRDYFISLNFYRNGELSRNQIGRSGVQVKKENETFTVVCLCSPQNPEFGHFTLLFCRGRQRNLHVQGDCFRSLNLLFCGVVVVVAVVLA